MTLDQKSLGSTPSRATHKIATPQPEWLFHFQVFVNHKVCRNAVMALCMIIFVIIFMSSGKQ